MDTNARNQASNLAEGLERMRLSEKLCIPAAPIGRLPNELLAHILVADWHEVEEGQSRAALSSLMRVCKHWRDVVESTPALWTIIDAVGHRDLAWLNLCLNRSGILQLTVNLTKPSEEMLDIVAHHTDRLTALSVCQHQRVQIMEGLPTVDLPSTQDLVRFLQRSMPNLRALEVMTRCLTNGMWHAPDPDITRQRFPLLSSLSCHSQVIPHDAQLFRGLASLTLKGCGRTGLTLSGLLDTLSTMRALHTLEISSTLFPLISRESHLNIPWRDPIVLPGLRGCTIQSDHPDDIRTFLAHVILPRDVDLIVFVSIYRATQDQTRVSLVDSLPPHPPETLPVLNTVQTVWLVINDDEEVSHLFGCSGYSQSPERWLEETVDSRAIQFSIRYDDCPTTISQPDDRASVILRDLIQICRPSPLRRLIVDCNHYCVSQPSGWEAMFRAFPCLTDLSLTGQGEATAMWEGLRAASYVAEGTSSLTVFPKLACVRIEGERIKATSEFFEELLACLRHRERLGALPLMDLVLKLGHGLSEPYDDLEPRYLHQVLRVVLNARYTWAVPSHSFWQRFYVAREQDRIITMDFPQGI